MPHTTRGTVVLMGSGEMAPSMVETHKYALSLIEGSVRAAFIDTPAGFQLNADLLSEKAVEYFEQKLNTPLSVVQFKNASTASREEVQAAVATLHGASYIFAGPGSPTYAIKNWRNSPVYDAIFETLSQGGCVTFASAAALTLGRFTIPVYEIYKVGMVDELEWFEGMDILSHSGVDVAIVPHWNNNSGGDHDTTRCFIGQPRWDILEAQLPASTTVLGIDEHTACILRIKENMCEVRGVGVVTVRRGDEETIFSPGDSFSLDLLRPADGTRGDLAVPASAANGKLSWESIRAQHDTLQAQDHPALADVTDYTYDLLAFLSRSRMEGDLRTMQQAEEALREVVVSTLAQLDVAPVDERAIVAPYVDLLLEQRAALREAKQYAQADALRDRLIEMGLIVKDTPEGVTWELPGG